MHLMMAFALKNQESDEAADYEAHNVVADAARRYCWAEGWELRKAKRHFRIRNAGTEHRWEVWGNGIDVPRAVEQMKAKQEEAKSETH